LDFIALGNVISMMHLLNRQYYMGTMSVEEMMEDEAVRWAYWCGIDALETYFVVSINETPVPIKALAERSLLIFAAAIVRMKQKFHSNVPKLEGCTSTRLRKEVNSLIQDRHSNLHPLYRHILHGRDGPIVWTHPGINVRVRDGEETDESLAFLEQCMFDFVSDVAPGGNGGSLEEQEPPESEEGMSDTDVAIDGVDGGTKRPRSGTSLRIIYVHSLHQFSFFQMTRRPMTVVKSVCVMHSILYDGMVMLVLYE
jgi:hypothetical protein